MAAERRWGEVWAEARANGPEAVAEAWGVERTQLGAVALAVGLRALAGVEQDDGPVREVAA